MTHAPDAQLGKAKHPPYTVADIFRKHIGEYKKTHRLSYEQHKAVSAIINCRTPAMGGRAKTLLQFRMQEVGVSLQSLQESSLSPVRSIREGAMARRPEKMDPAHPLFPRRLHH